MPSGSAKMYGTSTCNSRALTGLTILFSSHSLMAKDLSFPTRASNHSEIQDILDMSHLPSNPPSDHVPLPPKLYAAFKAAEKHLMSLTRLLDVVQDELTGVDQSILAKTYDKRVEDLVDKLRLQFDILIVAVEEKEDEKEKTKSDEDFVCDDEEATASNYEPSESEEEAEFEPSDDDDEE